MATPGGPDPSGPAPGSDPGLDLGTAVHATLVFCPGFLVAPAAYAALLGPVADRGIRVVVPRLVRPGPRLLLGGVSPATEADRAAAVVASVRDAAAGTAPVWIGGHSRGGGVAWIVAATGRVPVAGVVVVDPVAGGGPPWIRAATPDPLPTGLPALVLGAAIGGRCAPTGRNHVAFATAAPHATHVVVPDCGHADVLDDAAARRGRRLCGGGSDPARARRVVAGRIGDAVRAAP
jgi:pimeloyl-ACP methyl ester carboxylesterase